MHSINVNNLIQVIITVIIFIILLAIALVDVYTMKIPDCLIAILMIPVLLWITAISEEFLFVHILGAVCISIPMLLLAIVKSGCFGGGDIKLMLVAGLLLGFKNAIFAMILALVIGGIYSSYLLFSKKGSKKSNFAFGPFLVIGIVVSFLWGEEIILNYLRF